MLLSFYVFVNIAKDSLEPDILPLIRGLEGVSTIIVYLDSYKRPVRIVLKVI